MCFESYHLKESRLASMDMGVTTLLVFAFLFLFLTLERDNHYRRYFAVLSGVFFALASMTKLFAVMTTRAAYCWHFLDIIIPERLEDVGLRIKLVKIKEPGLTEEQVLRSLTVKI